MNHSVAALVLLLVAASAAADIFKAGEFRLQQGDASGAYTLTARLPAAVAMDTALVFPEGCSLASLQQQPMGKLAQLRIEFSCEGIFTAADVLITPWDLDGARLVSTTGAATVSMTLQRSPGGMRIPLLIGERPDRPTAELALVFLWQGMLHIWTGWDHLTFVLCLCLLTRGTALLGLITAFTLGHSISLGLAFFDQVQIAISPVEAIIALSIVLVARQALLTDRTTPVATAGIRRELVVVICFGLIHGLGFASALGELGVSSAERWPALIFFNLGVEAGQLLFVLLVVACFRLVRNVRVATILRSGLLYGAGSVGLFWTVERVAGFPWH